MMREDKATFKGLNEIFSYLISWLKTPEEKFAIQSKAVTDSLSKVAKTRSIELENLEAAAKLLKEVGYTDEQIKKSIGDKVENIIQIGEDLKTLRELYEKGVILDVRLKQVEPPKER